jgi:hypothetical protein
MIRAGSQTARYYLGIRTRNPNPLSLLSLTHSEENKETGSCVMTYKHSIHPCCFFQVICGVHRSGRNAHHLGWILIARTPRRTSLSLISCMRARRLAFSVTFPSTPAIRGVPSGRIAPVQKTSAELAARGQTMGSRFSGPDCSAHRSCWPVI